MHAHSMEYSLTQHTRKIYHSSAGALNQRQKSFRYVNHSPQIDISKVFEFLQRNPFYWSDYSNSSVVYQPPKSLKEEEEEEEE